MAKVIMVQGTMSGAGKSLLVAGLCRVFALDGYRVAPFKSQNMALNSFVTDEGLEMGRAQVMQAEAAGITPSVLMNPILLKPTSDSGSQVIVNGKVIGNMKAREYFEYKKQLVPDILRAYEELSSQVDIIVIEGAGSPAEINLKSEDIVNMGLAGLVDAPVILVGDIDRGGVFAQLTGTMLLLKDDEKDRVKGLVINKFRGDKTILDPGIDMLKEYTDVPVVGVLPYMDIMLDDEDSLTERFDKRDKGLINIAVVRFPRISNISDFSVFERFKGVKVNYVDTPDEIVNADMVILPGSKNTLGDLKWMRERGIESAVKKYSEHGIVFGICGGYQMLGDSVEDPDCTEQGGSMRGLELLPMTTVLQSSKVTVQSMGEIVDIGGPLSALSGLKVKGYEIHMGKSDAYGAAALCDISECGSQDTTGNEHLDGLHKGNVYGSYLHGFFDEGEIASKIVEVLARNKGLDYSMEGLTDYQAFRQSQYDKLADTVREYMDMDYIYKILQ